MLGLSTGTVRLACRRRVPPSRSLLVCATPRSGSTLLCESLAATGVAGCPREDFEALAHSRRRRAPEEYFTGVDDPEVGAILAQRPDPEPPAAVPEPYEAFLQDAVARGTTANGVFATKLMWGYLGDFLALVRPARRPTTSRCCWHCSPPRSGSGCAATTSCARPSRCGVRCRPRPGARRRTAAGGSSPTRARPSPTSPGNSPSRTPPGAASSRAGGCSRSS